MTLPGVTLCNANTTSPYGVTVYWFYNTTLPGWFPKFMTDCVAQGIGRVRIQLPWAFIESAAPVAGSHSYVWTALDYMVLQCNTNKIAISYTIQGQPSFYPAQLTPNGYKAPDPVSIAQFASDVAKRYNGDAASYGYIDTFELNEEFDVADNGAISGQSPLAIKNRIPDYFINALRVVAPAIKASHPKCRFGSCALWWQVLPHLTIFLTAVYNAGNLASYIDFWSVHWYPQESGSSGVIDPFAWQYTALAGYTVPTYPQAMTALYTTMASFGDLKPIRVTEGGWILSLIGYPGSANNVVSQDVQARNFYIWYNYSRKSGIVEGIDMWTYDYGSLHGPTVTNGYSTILYNNGTIWDHALAYDVVTNLIAAHPGWGDTRNQVASFLDGDSFILLPNLGGATRTASASSFGVSGGRGSSWTHAAGTGTPALIAGDLGQITGSTAVDYFTLGSATSKNLDIEFRLKVSNSGDSGGVICCTSGTTASTITCYYLKYTLAGISIIKVVNGTPTVLVGPTGSFTSGTMYRLRFLVTTSNGVVSLSAKCWIFSVAEPQAWTITITDSTSILGAGLFGIAAQSLTSAVQFDSFWAMQANAPTTLPPPIMSRFDGAHPSTYFLGN